MLDVTNSRLVRILPSPVTNTPESGHSSREPTGLPLLRNWLSTAYIVAKLVRIIIIPLSYEFRVAQSKEIGTAGMLSREWNLRANVTLQQ